MNKVKYYSMFVLHNTLGHWGLIVALAAKELGLSSVEKFFVDFHDQTYLE